MRTIRQITNNRFLNLKEVSDPKMEIKGYQFAERKGVDSVAFICYDSSKGEFFVNKKATPPLGTFDVRAFGGSLDKDVSKEEIVKAETLEEAGYVVDMSDIKAVGRSFVSTQMNQYCYLYLVLVSDKQLSEREPENATEALAEPQWMTNDEIIDGDDWKAITILKKAEKLGLISS